LSPIRQWDTTDWPRRIAGEIADLDPVALLKDRKIQKFIRRSDVFGLYAADQAIQDSGIISYRDSLDEAAANEFNDRTGVYVGSGGGSYQSQYDYFLCRPWPPVWRLLAWNWVPTSIRWLLCTLPTVCWARGYTSRPERSHACITNHSISGTLAIVEVMESLREGKQIAPSRVG
jgi:3-oxoacyl-[acyl-carrier-protein] synthase-1